MTKTISLAKYLFTRLRQQGIDTVHGVPGDYTLKALDHLKESGLKWVGNCNELNAGYAADGYARIKGLSALFTTYGVGELSAINAVAGSYAEHVPVIHVVGTPARHLQATGATVHHSLGDGRSRIFAEIHEKVTVAQANLIDADSAPEMIDNTIQQCLLHSRPGYIELPSDMVATPVPEELLANELVVPTKVDESLEDRQVDLLLEKIYSAKKPMILVDRGHGMPQMKQEINDLVRLSGIPTLTLPSGAGMVDHSLFSYLGVHSGPVGQIDTLPFVESSDLVLAFGPMYSDTQTLAWSVVPDSNKMITIYRNSIEYVDESVEVDSKTVFEKLVSRLQSTRISSGDVAGLGNFRDISLAEANPTSSIDQTTLYSRLNSFLRPDDVILLANATPVLGGRDFVLPSGSQVIASGMWFSIGHMLPAALGVALAQERGRTILFEGDGSFQVTAQELSTIIRERLDMTIFIINNSGYAYERHIHGMNEDYNDLAPWRYLEAASFFGAPSNGYKVETYRLKTWADLNRMLASNNFQDGKGLKLVEVIVDKYDIPERFKQVFRKAGEQL